MDKPRNWFTYRLTVVVEGVVVSTKSKIIVGAMVLFALAVLVAHARGESPAYEDYTFCGYDYRTLYSSGDTVLFSHTISSGDNRLLVVQVGVEVGEVVSNVIWGEGGALQQLTQGIAYEAVAGWRCELWYLVAPTVATANICILISNDHEGGLHCAANFTHVAQTNPIGNTAYHVDGEQGTEPDVVLATTYDSSAAWAGCMQQGGDTGPYTPASPAVEVFDERGGNPPSNPYGWGGYIIQNTSGNAVFDLDATGADPDDDWVMVAMELRNYEAPAGNVTVTPANAPIKATAVNPTVVAHTTVAPTYATSKATAVDPTVIAHTTVAPTHSFAAATAVDPTVMVTTHVTVAPTAAPAVALTVNPTVIAHTTVAPAPAPSVATAVDPTVMAGGNISVSSPAAPVGAIAVNPTVVAHTNVSPATAPATAIAVDPTVIVTANLVVVPTTAPAAALAVDPTVYANTNVFPTHATVVAIAVDPSVMAGGNIDLSPTAALVVAMAVGPTVYAHISIAPTAASVVATAVDPKMDGGGEKKPRGIILWVSPGGGARIVSPELGVVRW